MITTKELTGRVFNIQKYSIYDGEGIRTLIFFKGCNISCPWCSNPEGLNSNFQVMYSHDKCIDCGIQARRPLGVALVSSPIGVLLEIDNVPWLRVE